MSRAKYPKGYDRRRITVGRALYDWLVNPGEETAMALVAATDLVPEIGAPPADLLAFSRDLARQRKAGLN